MVTYNREDYPSSQVPYITLISLKTQGHPNISAHVSQPKAHRRNYTWQRKESVAPGK